MSVEPPPLERVGAFRLLREIGRGSYGVVYEAEQEEPRRRVALKLLHATWLAASQAARVEREAAALARFRHPGLAAIHAAGRVDVAGTLLPWIAMELVEGRPLDEWVARDDPPRRARIELLAQVADAVQHAHEHGVLHRDLKPANVLVQDDGRAKVVDFGVAALQDDDRRASERLTKSGAFVGTLAYVSPEQAGGGAVDARTDIYSLGVMAYELLVGRLPYETRDRTLASALRLVAEFEPVALRRIDPGLPHDLENIVRKAMEKEPERRYASAAALGADLRAWLEERPVAARAPSALYVATKFARRHRGLVAGGALALVALVGGFVLQGDGLRRARAALRESEARRSALFDLVQTILAGLTEAADLPGSRRVLEKTLSSVREVVDRRDLAPGDDERDESVLLAYATFLQAESDLLLRVERLDEALRSRRALLALRERLVAGADRADRSDPAARIERRRALAVARVLIGDVAKARADLDEAARWYREALALNEALAIEAPGHVGANDDLGYSYERLSDLAARRGDFDEADRLARLRMERVDALASLPSAGLEQRYHQVRARRFLLDVAAARLTPEESHELIERMHVLLASIEEVAPIERRLLLLQAGVVGLRAQVRVEAGDWAAADALQRAFEPKLLALAQRHPEDTEVGLALRRLRFARAVAASQLGDHAGAQRLMDEGIAELEALRAQAVGQDRIDLCNELGNQLLERCNVISRGDRDGALRHSIVAGLETLDALDAELPASDHFLQLSIDLCLTSYARRAGFTEQGLARLAELLEARGCSDEASLARMFRWVAAEDREIGRRLAGMLRASTPPPSAPLEALLRQVEVAAGK